MQLGSAPLVLFCATITVAVVAENQVVKNIGKCAEIQKMPSTRVATDGKTHFYDGCSVDIKNYDQLAGEYDRFRREWETKKDRAAAESAVREKEAEMRTKLKTERLQFAGIIAMATVFAVGFLSLLTLFFNWFNLFWMTFRVRRRLCSLNEKMVIAEKMLARRRFADDLIEKLSRLAEFDVTMNEEEIAKKLSSVYGGVDPAAKRNSP